MLNDPQATAGGPPHTAGGEGKDGAGRPGSTAKDTTGEMHPGGLCRDPSCDRCRAIRSAGGRRTRKAPWPLPGPIASLEDALVVLDWAARTLDPPRANAIDRLVKSWVRINDFAARIRALETRLAKLSTEGK
jgi:hypothetical protein